MKIRSFVEELHKSIINPYDKGSKNYPWRVVRRRL